mgnify:FL=1
MSQKLWKIWYSNNNCINKIQNAINDLYNKERVDFTLNGKLDNQDSTNLKVTLIKTSTLQEKLYGKIQLILDNNVQDGNIVILFTDVIINEMLDKTKGYFGYALNSQGSFNINGYTAKIWSSLNSLNQYEINMKYIPNNDIDCTKICTNVLYGFNGNYSEYELYSNLFDNYLKNYRDYMSKIGIDTSNRNLLNARFFIFSQKVQAIEKFNSNPSTTSKMDINKWTALTINESKLLVPKGLKFIKSNFGYQPSVLPKENKTGCGCGSKRVIPLPSKFENFSWSNKNGINYTTPIKDQGGCNDCWAFAGVEAVETVYALNQKLTNAQELSIQVPINCGNKGATCPYAAACDAGLMSGILWVMGGETMNQNMNNRNSEPGSTCLGNSNYQLGGTTTDSENPYISGNCGYCPSTTTDCCPSNPANCTNYNGSILTGTEVTSYEYQSPNLGLNVNTMANNIKKYGPIEIVVNASCPEFQNYSSGIISNTTGSCNVNPDHVVTLIGYGNDSGNNAVSNPPTGLNYFILRNHWGNSWGSSLPKWAQISGYTPENGYCLIEATNASNIIASRTACVTNIKLQ